MRQYLTDFMQRCAYPMRDAACLLAAYDAVMAETETQAVWESLLAIYEADIHCDYGFLRAEVRKLGERLRIHAYTMELLLFLGLSRYTQKRYAERGLSEHLFFHTMLDLRYKLEECREVYGISGSFVADWFVGFFNLTRFAFGRLQFEMQAFGKDYSHHAIRLTKDSPVINMHIPRTGTPLDPASCDEAFRMAASFYRPLISPDYPLVFVCHSWLLYPAQRDFLPPQSNLLAFMDRFEILESRDYEGSHPNLWRLFDRMYDGNPDHLPYDTSLRKAYVDRIKQGGKTGEGYGFFIYSPT